MKKNLFVLGAGASSEAGLPTGAELLKQIESMVNIETTGLKATMGDVDIHNALRHICNGNEEEFRSTWITACHQIRDGIPHAISIDNFLDSHKDNKKIRLCGKLAITKAILESERKSKLHKLTTNKSKKIEETWYHLLFKLLTENQTLKTVEENFEKFEVISFNYDRTLEFFLHKALQDYFQVTNNHAAQIVKSLRIIHPYGTVGNLEFYNEGQKIPFGGSINPDELIGASLGIQTFTETSRDMYDIHESVSCSKRIVFLGFAFHDINVKLLTPKELTREPVEVFGTRFDISEYDIGALEKKLKSIRPAGIHANTTTFLDEKDTCTNLFKKLHYKLRSS